MTYLSRRRAIVATGCAVTGGVAGCLDDEPASDDESTDDNDRLADAVTDEGVVEYPDFVGDEISVDEDAGRIEYEDPAAEYLVDMRLEGEVPSTDEMGFGRDLSADVLTAFIGPELDGDEQLTYHVFANEAFADYADWNAIHLEGETLLDEEAVTFDELDHGVFHLSVRPPSDALWTAIANEEYDAFDDDGSELTFVAIQEKVAPGEEPVPAVSFSTDIDNPPDGPATVVINHLGGDDFASEHVVAEVGDEIVEDPFDEATVSEDDSARLEGVPKGTEVQLVYDNGDNEDVLVSVTVPEN